MFCFRMEALIYGWIYHTIQLCPLLGIITGLLQTVELFLIDSVFSMVMRKPMCFQNIGAYNQTPASKVLPLLAGIFSLVLNDKTFHINIDKIIGNMAMIACL